MKNLLYLVMTGCVAVQIFFTSGLKSERRVYWACAGIASGAAFFLGYPDWKEEAGAALFTLAAMTLAAWAYTPYIKIRGKIYALSVQDTNAEHEDCSRTSDSAYDPAPDAYSGLLTATKLWWIVLVSLIISAVNIYVFITSGREFWVAAVGAAMLVLFAVGTGLGDASWGYGIARGQYVQFVLAAVITAGTFTMVYLISYFIAKRRPLRRGQSMEYRAHPRHQKNS